VTLFALSSFSSCRASASSWLAHRTGRESCWAEFSSDAERSLCIPHRLWIRDFSAEDGADGVWRASSPLQLEPGHAKSTLYFQITRSQPIRISPPPLFDAVREKIEKRREELSEWLRGSGSDRSGLFRHLLLNEDSSSVFFFRLLGLVHILTASGLHLAVLATLVNFLLSISLRLTPMPAPLAIALRRIVVTSLWGWCWALAGMKLKMLRPIFLLALQGLARKFGFRWKTGAPLILALFLDILLGASYSFYERVSIWPALSDPGRLFYLIAMGGGSKSLGDTGLFERTKRLGLTAISSWLSISVYLLITSRLIPLGTVVLSILTIPLIAGVIYPVLVLGSLTSLKLSPVLHIGAGFLDSLAVIALRLYSVWWVSEAAVVIAILSASLLWFFPPVFRRRIGSFFLIFCAGLAFCHFDFWKNTPLGLANRVEQLDVGQGDSALITEKELSGLIDTGSVHALNDGQWLDVFSRLGIFRLNWIAVTHLDEDHSGGIMNLAEVIPVDCATTSREELESPRGRRWSQKLKDLGIHVTDRLNDCIPYPALGPDPVRGPHSANENMSSFFVPLAGGGFYLSAGDATWTAEPRTGAWAARLASSLSSGPRILKISHHGSKTSSNPVFLEQVHPTEAWISDGVGNRYGHPSAVVLERLRDEKIPFHRTDQEGTLEIRGGDDHRRQ
jgi:competence protein ComEC